MKPFNLDEYLKNPNKKVITRDGNSVRILCTDAKGNFPIVALVKIYNGAENVIRLKENGCFYNDTENSSDLFFVPEKREGWTNVYEEGTNRYLNGCICSTEEEAKRIRGYGYITTIKIEWEE